MKSIFQMKLPNRKGNLHSNTRGRIEYEIFWNGILKTKGKIKRRNAGARKVRNMSLYGEIKLDLRSAPQLLKSYSKVTSSYSKVTLSYSNYIKSSLSPTIYPLLSLSPLKIFKKKFLFYPYPSKAQIIKRTNKHKKQVVIVLLSPFQFLEREFFFV